MKGRISRAAVMAVAVAVSGALVSADTLMLRNGSRLSGRLLGIRNGVIDFEEERGGQRRTVRLDQDEVRTIEFDVDGFDSPIAGIDARPRGMREREVSVSARTDWTETGITVKAGQTVYFSASGRVRWGPGRQDGPEGESGSPRNPGRPIPARPGAALIGRVGDDAAFFVGNDQSGVRMRSSGPLFLGINDDVLDDNTGAFRVTVYY